MTARVSIQTEDFDLSREVAIHRQYLGSYGYVICCLQKDA